MRLDSEKSLYLKQHADNPVFWYPWGDEAFAEAKRIKQTNNVIDWIFSMSLVSCYGS